MKELANQIVAWLDNYAVNSKRDAFTVGVSGGVDSGLVSTLCAMTGKRTCLVVLPCESFHMGIDNANKHIDWLQGKYSNVERFQVDLTSTFTTFKDSLPPTLRDGDAANLAFANAKSRLRMIALYQVATLTGGLVVGTGNKVEDYGVGFFTKYGDGGVDLSPIADLTKTEVRKMATDLGVIPEVAGAIPTDGLWTDGRSDESQIGATYQELEWVMQSMETNPYLEQMGSLNDRQKEVIKIYNRWHNMTAHKTRPIPTFKRA